MRLGFFHDHQFIVDDSNVYTSGTLHAGFWSRYFVKGVDTLLVCARKINASAASFRSSSSEGVEFEFSPSLSNVPSLLLSRNLDVVCSAVERVDVVVARLPSEIGLAALDYANRLNKTTIVEVVACASDALSNHGSLIGKIYAPVLKLRMKRAVAKANGALYVTNRVLQKRYPNKKNCVSASNVEIFEVANQSGRSDRYFSRKQKGKVKAGLTGTLANDLKGIDIAINALKDLPVELHVFGGGDASRFVELAARKKVDVQFHGFVSDKNQLFSFLDDMDFYIQPSLQEGLPRATIEAMSRGCPVLSSDAGGLVELVVSEYVHTKGDVHQFRAQIIKFLSSGLYSELSDYSLGVASKYLFTQLSGVRTAFYEGLLRDV